LKRAIGAEGRVLARGATNILTGGREMIQTLVAVPKSTTMHGPPYFSNAAMPVAYAIGAKLGGLVDEQRQCRSLMPGSTKSGSMLK